VLPSMSVKRKVVIAEWSCTPGTWGKCGRTATLRHGDSRR